jgi:hypothetical protein
MMNGDVGFRLARVSNGNVPLPFKKEVRKRERVTGMKKVTHKCGKYVRMKSRTTVKLVKMNMQLR